MRTILRSQLCFTPLSNVNLRIHHTLSRQCFNILFFSLPSPPSHHFPLGLSSRPSLLLPPTQPVAVTELLPPIRKSHPPRFTGESWGSLPFHPRDGASVRRSVSLSPSSSRLEHATSGPASHRVICPRWANCARDRRRTNEEVGIVLWGGETGYFSRHEAKQKHLHTHACFYHTFTRAT